MNLFAENQFTETVNGVDVVKTWLPCTITEISEGVFATKKKDADGELLADDEQTKFRRCVITIDTPKGVKEIDANVWAESLAVNGLVFKVGGECRAVFEISGDFKGSVWLGLPEKRNVDFAWFGEEVEAPAKGAEADKLNVG